MAVSSHQFEVICYVEVVARTFYLRNAGRKHKNKTKIIYRVLRWNPRKEGQDRDGRIFHYVYYMFGSLNQVVVFFFSK